MVKVKAQEMYKCVPREDEAEKIKGMENKHNCIYNTVPAKAAKVRAGAQDGQELRQGKQEQESKACPHLRRCHQMLGRQGWQQAGQP